MQRVKLFKGVETEIDKLEDEINAWLESSDARIVSMFGNIAPQTPGSGKGTTTRAYDASDLFLAVVYET